MSPDCTVSRLTDLLGNDSTDVLPLTNAGPSALGIKLPPPAEEGAGYQKSHSSCEGWGQPLTWMGRPLTEDPLYDQSSENLGFHFQKVFNRIQLYFGCE